VQHGKELVVYISMGFGNPYGDEYSAAVAIEWVGRLTQMGIRTIAMSDTVGVAQPDNIAYIFSNLIPEFKDIHIGAHFHSTPTTWKEKIQTAYDNGCLRFDSSVNGIGGCPMAEDELVGNIATENVLDWCAQQGIETGLDIQAFGEAVQIAGRIFI